MSGVTFSMKPYKLKLEPVLQTVTFKQFVDLLFHHEPLVFTDGYVFGSTDEISLDSGVDTTVPGGDSSYHACDIGTLEAVKLTQHGFQVPSESNDGKMLQFYFMAPATPPVVTSIRDLAALQATDPLHMLVEQSTYGIVGETALFFSREPRGIFVYALNHFEDPELISDPLQPLDVVTTHKQSICIPRADLDKHGSYITKDTFQYLRPIPAPW